MFCSMKIEMEYSLLKTIESAYTAPQITFSSNPRLSPYPAFDFVNPGLGQISRLFSFYVPLHSSANTHTIRKKVELPLATNLEGFGNQNTEEEQEDVEEIPEKDIDPLEYNNLKRKQMGAAVQESFLHPKVIKTDTINLAVQPKNISKNNLSSTIRLPEKAPAKNMKKHKFHVV